MLARSVRSSLRAPFLTTVKCFTFTHQSIIPSAPFLDSEWKKPPPSGFAYTYLADADVVTLIPDGWRSVRESHANNIQYCFTKDPTTSIIEQPNVQPQPRFRIDQWKCNQFPSDLVMEQVSTKHLGVLPSIYLSQFIALTRTQLEQQAVNTNSVLSHLKELNVHVLDYKSHNLPNILQRKSIEYIHLVETNDATKQAETSTSDSSFSHAIEAEESTQNLSISSASKYAKLLSKSDVPPAEKAIFSADDEDNDSEVDRDDIQENLLGGHGCEIEDTYVLSHVFSLPEDNAVVSFLFECPMSQYSAHKSTVDTILDHSVLRCHSNNKRILFSSVLTQTPSGE